MKTITTIIITGVIAGFINGLFGTGGGIVIILCFTLLKTPSEKTFATSNLTVLLLSLVSLFLYVRNGMLTGEVAVYFFENAFVPAVLGGAVGSLLLSKISPKILNKLFSFLVMVGGIGRMFK